MPPEDFSHGATRNLLAERSCGSHVAFLTQDAVPADERWLAHLLEGFRVGRRRGPRVRSLPGPARASLMVRRELDRVVRLARPPAAEREPSGTLPTCGARSSPTPTAAWPGRPGSACPFAPVGLRGGSAAGARHARRRLREGLPARRRRDPLPSATARSTCSGARSTNGAGCARCGPSRRRPAPARLRSESSARCATTLPSPGPRASAARQPAHRRGLAAPSLRSVRRAPRWARAPIACRRPCGGPARWRDAPAFDPLEPTS